jgi:ABC-type nickel/cobalt efflux system permease component RcnA
MRSRVALPALFLLFATSPAAAHPLTDLRFDRTAAVRLSGDGVEVTYTLELSAFALHLDAAKRLTTDDIAALDKTARGLAAAYARRVATDIAEKFRVAVDGQPLPLRVTGIDVSIGEHATCRFTLAAPWPPGGRDRKLTVTDETFPDKTGVINLTVAARGSGRPVELLDVDDPPIRIRTTHSEQLKPEERSLARMASAEVRLPAAVAAPRSPDHGPAMQPLPEPTVNADDPPANLFEDLRRRGLPALFDSKLGIGLLLLVAFLFGAAHAFTPGHGKTLVAAYLVGESGTVRHAVILGIATTVAHTGSVIAVAAVLWAVYGNTVPAAAQGTLQFVAGLLVIAVGLWLLLRRATGQSDHFHLFGHHHHHGHSHGHGHSHTHDPIHHHPPKRGKAKTPLGWGRLVLMGLGGGLVPCWDAVLLLVAAGAMGRLGFALPLLFAFSLGLGVVLVLLGVSVVYAHRAGQTRFKDSRWFRMLPVVSAVLLVGIGIWLCKQAVGMALK